MKSEWSCDGCRSIVRFDEGAEPWECFATGILTGLQLSSHRRECLGNHHENGNTSIPSLEAALLGAVVDGKSWGQIVEEQ